MIETPIMVVWQLGRATVTISVPDGGLPELLEIWKSPFGLTALRLERAYNYEVEKRRREREGT